MAPSGGSLSERASAGFCLVAAILSMAAVSQGLRVRPLSLYPHSAHAAARRAVLRRNYVASFEPTDGEDASASGTAIPMTPTVTPSTAGGVQWNVSSFRQRLDHFSFTAEAESTFFDQKYIFYDRFWEGPEAGAPIFLYCGNEGPIEWFLDNAGWITEIAAEFGALVVGPEHRYYGDSQPFGSEEAAYKDVASRAFLTTEQALADMAIFLDSLKRNLSAQHSPVISFGGSYGGMMAAWFRLKYPHITAGAIASSAPILQYQEVVPQDIFYSIVSRDYSRESASCYDYLQRSWAAIRGLGEQENGLEKLQRKFGLCGLPRSSQDVIFWLEDALVNLAMVDYPVPAEFLMPLPAYPIRELCRRVDSLPEGSDLVDRMVAGASVYFNYTGFEPCFEIDADPHGESGWNYQACTEQCMPMSSNASNSLFEPFQWNQSAFDEDCRAQFGVSPRPAWILQHFGGRDIKQELKSFGSNIVFSNGELDPWSGGGVNEDISETIVSLVIPDGAHHLDLRASTPQDPPSVVWQRNEEKKHIRRWIKAYRQMEGGAQHSADMVPGSQWTLTVFAILLIATAAALLSAILSAATFMVLLRAQRGGLGRPLLYDYLP